MAASSSSSSPTNESRRRFDNDVKDNPIVKVRADTARERVVLYYLSKGDANVIAENLRQFALAYQRHFVPKDTKALSGLNASVPRGVSPAAYYYSILMSMVTRIKGSTDYLANARLQTLLAEARRFDVDYKDLDQHVRNLEKQTRDISTFYRTLKDIFLANVERRRKEPGTPAILSTPLVTELSSPFTGVDADTIEDHYTIVNWIAKNAKRLWPQVIAERAARIFADRSVYTDEDIQALRAHVVVTLETGTSDALRRFREVNTAAKDVNKRIVDDRSALQVIDGYLSRNVTASSSSSSSMVSDDSTRSKRGRSEQARSASSQSSLAMEIQSSNDAVRRAMRFVEQKRWDQLTDIRNALGIDLSLCLQIRQNLYDIIGWPPLKTRELVDFKDLPDMIVDMREVVRAHTSRETRIRDAQQKSTELAREQERLIEQGMHQQEHSGVTQSQAVIKKTTELQAAPSATAISLAAVEDTVEDLRDRRDNARRRASASERAALKLDMHQSSVVVTQASMSSLIDHQEAEARKKARQITTATQSNDEVKRAYEELDAARKELQQTQERLRAQETTVASLQGMQDRAKRLEATAKKYAEELAVARALARPDLQKQLDDALAEVKRLTNIASEEGEQIRIYAVELNRVNGLLAESASSSEGTRRLLQERQQRDATIAQLTRERDEAQANVDAYHLVNEQREKELDAVNEDLDAARKQLAAATAARDVLAEDLQAEKAKIQKHSKSQTSVEATIRKLEKQVAEEKRKQRKLQEDVNEQKEIASTSSAELKKYQSARKTEVRTEEASRRKLEKQLENAQKQVQAITRELNDSTDSVTKLTNSLTELNESLREITQARDDAQLANDALEKELGERVEQIELQNEDIRTLLERLDEFKNTDAEYQASLERERALERQLADERSRYEQLESDLERVRATPDVALTAERDALVRERDGLRLQIDALPSIDSTITDLAARHKDVVDGLAAQILQNTTEYANLQRKHDETVRDNAELQRQVENLEAELARARDDDDHFRTEAGSLDEELEEAEQRYRDLRALNEREKRQRQEEIDALTEQARVLEASLAREQETSKALLDRLSAIESESVDTRDRLVTLTTAPSSASSSVSPSTVVTVQPSSQDLVAVVRELINSGRLQAPVQDETPVVLFDINAERERYRAIADQLSILDNSRAFDAMEDYILTSGDIDSSVFVVLDAFSRFVNAVEGATNSRKGTFWTSDSKSHKGIIRDIIDAASTETEYSHALDLADFTNLQPLVLSLIERSLRNYYLESASARPELLFEPLKALRPVRLSAPDADESFTRDRLGALPVVYPHDKIFNAAEQLREDYDFLDMLRMYVLPVLNQPSRNIYFSLAVPIDGWTRKSEGATLVGVAHELTNGVMGHLHVFESGKRRRRPTRLSVRKFLSDLLIANTTTRVQHSGVRYQNVNMKILSILDSVVANGFLSAFTFCLGKVGVPVDFGDERMYSALNNVDFRELVVLYYNLGVSRTQASRAQIATATAALQFSDKLDFFEDPRNRIRPMPIPTREEVYTSAPQSRYEYVQQLVSSEAPEYQAQRRRVQRVRRSAVSLLF